MYASLSPGRAAVPRTCRLRDSKPQNLEWQDAEHGCALSRRRRRRRSSWLTRSVVLANIGGVSVPPDEELPAVMPVHAAQAGRRRALVGAAAVGVLLAVATLKPWEGPVSSVAVDAPPGSQSVPSLAGVLVTPPAATLPAGPTPSPTDSGAVTLAAGGWLLDFKRSGIPSLVCLNRDGQRCLTTGELASGLQFRGGNVSGGTGVGGGCDDFAGTDELDGSSLRISVPTYQSRCYDTGADLSIRLRLDHVARFAVANGTLTLLDAAKKVLLVYRR